MCVSAQVLYHTDQGHPVLTATSLKPHSEGTVSVGRAKEVGIGLIQRRRVQGEERGMATEPSCTCGHTERWPHSHGGVG